MIFPGGRANNMGTQNVACQEERDVLVLWFRAGQVESVQTCSLAGCMGRSGV